MPAETTPEMVIEAARQRWPEADLIEIYGPQYGWLSRRPSWCGDMSSEEHWGSPWKLWIFRARKLKFLMRKLIASVEAHTLDALLAQLREEGK